MGVSTDAILFWGILLETEELELNTPWIDDKEKYDGDWEIYYLELHGVTYPDHDAPKEEREVYWAEYDELLNNMPCGIGIHCSGDSPLHYAYIDNSLIRAYRGFPEEVKSLEIVEFWRAQLQEFCQKMGLDWQEPKWWLVSYWG